ncbi:MAG: toll/interleukin-1 receptor domain-containing protein [Acidobacteriia bacterium]|nr:toll/interleukin-1 receptor domain-containing protein [Terriglobia bacterium]
MADIFISYVHEEAAIAEALQTYLRDVYAGQKVFLSSDQWQIFAGDIWFDRIRAELGPAKVVILLLSKRSVARPWVNFEAGAAWLSDKKIIPVCIGDLDKGDLPKPYSSIQAVSLPEDHYYLLTSIGHHLGTVISPLPGTTDDHPWLAILRARINELFPASV